MNHQKQFFNGIGATLADCRNQEKSAHLARKKFNFLFEELLTDVSDLATMIENKIDTDLNTFKKTLTVKGLIKTFPKTTVGLALASGFLVGKSTAKDSNLNYSSIDKSRSEDLLNEIKAVGLTFLTRYLVNLLSETLDSAMDQKTPRSDPH